MSFLKNSAVYIGTNIINAVIPFILLPIITRTISQEDYGAVTMFQMVVTGLGAFVGLSTHGAASRKYFDNPALEETREYNGACLQILLVTFGICFLALTLFSEYLTKALNLTSGWIYLALTTSGLGFIVQLRLGQWQVRHKATAYAVLQLSQAAINFILTWVLVLQLHKAGAGRIEAIVAATAFTAVVSLIYLIKDNIINVFSFNKEFLADALSFGAPLIPHIVGSLLLNSADRLVIGTYLGLKEVAIYAVAFQISLGLNVIFSGINQALIPWLFTVLARDNEEEKRDLVRKTYLWFLVLLFGIVLGFIIGPSFVVLYAGDKYQESAKIIGLLCAGQIFSGMYLMVTNYIFYAKKTGGLSLITLFSGGINILLSIILIQHYGLIGVAISFSISKLIHFLLTWFLAYRVIPAPWFNIAHK